MAHGTSKGADATVADSVRKALATTRKSNPNLGRQITAAKDRVAVRTKLHIAGGELGEGVGGGFLEAR